MVVGPFTNIWLTWEPAGFLSPRYSAVVLPGVLVTYGCVTTRPKQWFKKIAEVHGCVGLDWASWVVLAWGLL